ncbi:MAG: ArsR family transcriptional regulator [Cellvibrionaceae bacterium]|nr:ArsR family transcriptional regulator [Cellvibrionaceae bacterium]
MTLTPQIEAFVYHFGEMGSRWGFNRTVGQMYALIMVSEQPLCANDLSEALSISRGNVSMGLKELQAWRLLQEKRIPGDRKEYFTAAGSVWDMAIRVLEERRRREVDPTLSLLRDTLLETPANQQEVFAQHKMREIHDLLELCGSWADELMAMQPEKLKTLMKLGSGVGKVLEFTDKLSLRSPD